MSVAGHDKTFRGFLDYMRQPLPVRDLLVLAGLMLAVGIAFHTLYPFPFTFPDSGSYVLTAKEGTFNVYRPMGYSTYMSWVHGIASGPTALFAVSYLLSGLATLFALFSARYLLGIERRWVFYAMSLAAILSPRIIFSTNFIMSDGLFTTLVMIFTATALWLVFSRNLLLVAAHLLVFVALYKVRYSGMFLLPVSMAALWCGFGGRAAWLRIVAALVPVLIFGALFNATKSEYARQTGVDTFSGFGGWQLVNNASTLMPEAKEIRRSELPVGVQPVHEFLSLYPDSLFDCRHTMTTDYMWSNELPYKQFLFYYMQSTGMPYPQAWASVGKLYGDYAGSLIGRYPGRYLTRYLLPSAGSLFRCGRMIEEGMEFKGEPLYREYFSITQQTYRHSHTFFTDIYPVRAAFNVVWWLALGVCAVWFCVVMLRRGLPGRKQRTAAAILLGFILIYLGSSAIASPCTTWRYTMPMFVPSVVFVFYCVSAFIDKRRGDAGE